VKLLLPLHPINGLFSRTTWVSRHQKGKTNLDLLEEETLGDFTFWISPWLRPKTETEH